jgi:hypothetical protein
MKEEIEKEIRKAINRHLVLHVPTKEGDTRCRITILVEEASAEIIKIIDKPYQSGI